MPLDVLMGLPASEVPSTADEYVEQLKNTADRAYRIAREHLRASANRRKTYYDIRVRRQPFAVSDWVWYLYPRRYKGRSLKWQKNYVGPFKIIRVMEPSNYVIQKSQRSAPMVVHADKLKKCYNDVAELEVKFGAVQREQQRGVPVAQSMTAELPPDRPQQRPTRNRRAPAYLDSYV